MCGQPSVWARPRSPAVSISQLMSHNMFNFVYFRAHFHGMAAFFSLNIFPRNFHWFLISRQQRFPFYWIAVFMVCMYVLARLVTAFEMSQLTVDLALCTCVGGLLVSQLAFWGLRGLWTWFLRYLGCLGCGPFSGELRGKLQKEAQLLGGKYHYTNCTYTYLYSKIIQS